jgi:TonB family protein
MSLVLVVFVLLQTPTAKPATGFVPNCLAPADAGISSLCAGDELMRRAVGPDADDDLRDKSWEDAAEAFRRAVDLARDAVSKKYALDQLESVYDEAHLDRARDAEPVLRELIALSPSDLVPLFRLARVQERQEQFEAAQSTLLAAEQMKPDDVEPYRQLAQFFARRAAALSADKARQSRQDRPVDNKGPDKDGVYRLGEGVQAPEMTSTNPRVKLPNDVVASGVKGSVALEILVNAEGRVVDARVLRSVPLLDDVALETVRQWQFRPASVGGRAVPVWMTVVVNF